MLGLFGVSRFEELAADLKGAYLEGLDENNVSNFHQALRLRLFERKELPRDLLLAYDQNIVRHWRQITDRRNAEEKRLLKFKYFQYLTLLFSEIYLDRWFRDPDQLLADLNAHVEAFNEDKPQGDRLSEYAPEDLRKLAFWNATGSGKTLLMHVNILQYRHYLEQNRRAGELNRTILLTPNEGLKGIRNLEGRGDPKIAFHKTIKELEVRFGDPLVTLASFIVANTPHAQVKWWSDGMTKDEFEACNVLFQKDDPDSYIGKLLGKVVGPT